MFTRFLLAFTLFVSCKLFAQPIIPDVSFNDDGFAFPDSSRYFTDLTVLPNGGIICLGKNNNNSAPGAILLKYTLDGIPDNSFGVGGQTTIQFPENWVLYATTRMVMQSDGKILSNGSIENYQEGSSGFFLARHKANGEPDSSFNGTGVVTEKADGFSTQFFATNAVVQNDGKIIQLRGYPVENQFIYAKRFNTDGSLDSTYGNNGSATAPWTAQLDFPNILSIGMQHDGKVILLCINQVFSQGSSTVFMRLNTNGSIDSSFGTNGISVVDVDVTNQAEEFLWNIAVQPDDKIIAYGWYGPATITSGVLVRVNRNGTPDDSFGTNGIARIQGNDFRMVMGVALENDGSIICAGYKAGSTPPSGQRPALVKLTSSGSIDNNFGTNGFVITNNVTGSGIAEHDAVAVFGNRIITCGVSWNTDANGTIIVYKKVNSTVPLRLLKFYALQQPVGIKLFWQAAEQTDMVKYFVQKSTDGITFYNAGIIPVSTSKEYTFIDTDDKADVCFYRLQCVHTDGSFTYSNIIRLVNNNVSAGIYPNPVVNTLNLVLNTTQKNTLIKIADATGRIVKEMKLDVIVNTPLPINVEHLPAGAYFVLISGVGDILRIPFMKQN